MTTNRAATVRAEPAAAAPAPAGVTPGVVTPAEGSPARTAPDHEAARARLRRRLHLPRRLRLPRVTLAGRFLAANLAILVGGGLVVGVWIGNTLERGIVDRTASVTALYVESFVEPHLQDLASGGSLQPSSVAQLDSLLEAGPLRQLVVSLRVWTPGGTIVYGSLPELVGQTLPVKDELEQAFDGVVTADFSDLTSPENSVERRYWTRLLEMYVPVRASGSDRIVAAVEFYQLPDAIDREVRDARLASWGTVAAAISLSFLLLYGIVKQGSDTIRRQEKALERQVGELSTLLDQNAALNERVRAAAERNTTLNEQSLRRISGHLHDGPGQTLSLALMRLDAIKTRSDALPPATGELEEVQRALQDAMRDMRAIAAGLRMPELTGLTVPEIALRAVQDHARRTGLPIDLETVAAPDQVALPVKIALFRALQELLSNATRHGGGGARVTLAGDGQFVALHVADSGKGFDVQRLASVSGLGLAGMREQAELLGGDFEISSSPGAGTDVRVRWPLPRGRKPPFSRPTA